MDDRNHRQPRFDLLQERGDAVMGRICGESL